MTDAGTVGEWVFLTYALPRNPSAPRLALWRRLRRLGVAQLADGLVSLPSDARTREQLEWAADEVSHPDADVLALTHPIFDSVHASLRRSLLDGNP